MKVMFNQPVRNQFTLALITLGLLDSENKLVFLNFNLGPG